MNRSMKFASLPAGIKEDSQWTLFHQPSLARIDELNHNQARVVLDGLAKETLSDWFVWFEGLGDWVRADELLGRLNPKGRSAVVTNGSEFMHWSSERRQEQRYRCKLKAYIDHNGFIYSNEVIDISRSLDGIKLAKDLPDTISGKFRVIVTDGTGEITLLCRRIKDNDNPDSRGLLIRQCSHKDVLLSMVLSRCANTV